MVSFSSSFTVSKVTSFNLSEQGVPQLVWQVVTGVEPLPVTLNVIGYRRPLDSMYLQGLGFFLYLSKYLRPTSKPGDPITFYNFSYFCFILLLLCRTM